MESDTDTLSSNDSDSSDDNLSDFEKWRVYRIRWFGFQNK